MPLLGQLLSPGNTHARIFAQDALKYPHFPQVSATHQRLVLELSDLQAESTDCGEDEQGSATASNGGVSTVGGAGRGRGGFDPDFVQHGSGMRYSTSNMHATSDF